MDNKIDSFRSNIRKLGSQTLAQHPALIFNDIGMPFKAIIHSCVCYAATLERVRRRSCNTINYASQRLLYCIRSCTTDTKIFSTAGSPNSSTRMDLYWMRSLKPSQSTSSCRILVHGAARVCCDGCKHSLLIAFYFKRRGVCPSCGAKRAVKFAQTDPH
jgi:hypothetical protein